jgi:glutamate racemase
MEPMVKPAAEQTKSGVIAVCATPATLASDRYAYLKSEYASGITVLEPDCSQWATMIETNTIDEKNITAQIKEVIDSRADVIVLGCTHYHWIEQLIIEGAHGRAKVLQPEIPVLKQLARVLSLDAGRLT